MISSPCKNLKTPHSERVEQWLSSTEGNRDTLVKGHQLSVVK